MKLNPPLQLSHCNFVDIRQSMMNGGGPACLRFKTVVNDEEFSQVNQKFLLNPKKLMDLRSLVSKHYRDNLSPEDLMDIQLMEESYTFLDELTQLLDLGSIYSFPKNLKLDGCIFKLRRLSRYLIESLINRSCRED